ncbi:hypothetical protein LTR86_005107 [Recurvomyces mirabilis]|nr:hypothetical protein LTR86_005107 [Recurvomyces mirabilis]
MACPNGDDEDDRKGTQPRDGGHGRQMFRGPQPRDDGKNGVRGLGYRSKQSDPQPRDPGRVGRKPQPRDAGI